MQVADGMLPGKRHQVVPGQRRPALSREWAIHLGVGLRIRHNLQLPGLSIHAHFAALVGRQRVRRWVAPAEVAEVLAVGEVLQPRQRFLLPGRRRRAGLADSQSGHGSGAEPEEVPPRQFAMFVEQML